MKIRSTKDFTIQQEKNFDNVWLTSQKIAKEITVIVESVTFLANSFFPR